MLTNQQKMLDDSLEDLTKSGNEINQLKQITNEDADLNKLDEIYEDIRGLFGNELEESTNTYYSAQNSTKEERLKWQPKKFSQTDFMKDHEDRLGRNVWKANEKYSGICQALCSLVTILGHDHELIKGLLENKKLPRNVIDPIDNALDKIAIDAHVLNLVSIVERIKFALYGEFPATKISGKDQKQMLVSNPNNHFKSINRNVLEKAFNDMTPNEYMQISFVKSKKFGFINQFDEGHACLLFKTVENEKTYYNFFDPNKGFYKEDNIEDIAICIDEETIGNYPCNNIGIIDLKQILSRSKVGAELISEYEKKNSVQQIK